MVEDSLKYGCKGQSYCGYGEAQDLEGMAKQVSDFLINRDRL